MSKRPAFLDKEEQEAHRWYEAWKDKVVNHQQESIGECYTSLKRQAGWYDQEVRSLWFFEPDHNADLACHVLAIVDWAEEYNEMSTHPIPDIPSALEVPYSGPRQARGQFPLRPVLEESGTTDI